METITNNLRNKLRPAISALAAGAAPAPAGGGGGFGIPLAALMDAFRQRGDPRLARWRAENEFRRQQETAQPQAIQPAPAPGGAQSAGIINPNPPRLEDLSPEDQAKMARFKELLAESNRPPAGGYPVPDVIEENPQGPRPPLTPEAQARFDEMKALLPGSAATSGPRIAPLADPSAGLTGLLANRAATPAPEVAAAPPPENPFMQLFRRPAAPTAAYGPAALGDLMKGIDLSSLLKGALGRPQPAASAPGAVYLPSSTPGVGLGQPPPVTPAPSAGVPLNRLMAARRARPVRRAGQIRTMPVASPAAVA